MEIHSTLPGYRIYEYLLVLSPHEELRNRISQVRKEFREKYDALHTGGRPHIGLAHFTQYEMMEERIINRLNLVAMSFPPFKTELKDFGSFPSHTICLQVISKIPVQKLVKNIRAETQRLMKWSDEQKPFFMLEPYISIARKLKPWQYEKGWLEYSRKHFTGRFIAKEMLLLKRMAGEIPYQILKRFEFQNLPVATVQGDLFH